MQTAQNVAQTLLTQTMGLKPGTALTDKATAIQAAVDASPPQTATACADITDYLGLVTAQTGKKKLSPSNVTTLTMDANNLAVMLGC